jgi:hypothetical protein
VANLRNIRAIFSQQSYNLANAASNMNSMYALDQSNTTLWAWGYNNFNNLGIYQTENLYVCVCVFVCVCGLFYSRKGRSTLPLSAISHLAATCPSPCRICATRPTERAASVRACLVLLLFLCRLCCSLSCSSPLIALLWLALSALCSLECRRFRSRSKFGEQG